MRDSRDLGHYKYAPKWSNELKKLKKDAHYYVDNTFPNRALAYDFVFEHTGRSHISELNEDQLRCLIKKFRKRGSRKFYKGML
jgi:hypothetical protein